MGMDLDISPGEVFWLWSPPRLYHGIIGRVTVESVIAIRICKLNYKPSAAVSARAEVLLTVIGGFFCVNRAPGDAALSPVSPKEGSAAQPPEVAY